MMVVLLDVDGLLLLVMLICWGITVFDADLLVFVSDSVPNDFIQLG